MRARIVPTAAIMIVVAACTNEGSADTAPPPSTVTQPTSDVPGTIVEGEWTYALYGIKATFTWKDTGPATLDVKNGSDQPVGAPALYIVTRDQRHVDGRVADASPLDPSASGRYTVTFPGDLRPDEIGLVVLELGGVNWGALGPKLARASA